MQNNFNDTINKLKDFNLNPSEQVWKEIESNLDEKKKRRIVAWWWIFPLIGLFVTPIFILSSNNLNVSDTNKMVSSSIKNNEKKVQGFEKEENRTAELLKNEYPALKSHFSSPQNSFARMQKPLSSITSAFTRVQKRLSHTQNDSARVQMNLKYTQNDSVHVQKRLSHTQNDFAGVQLNLTYTQNDSVPVQTLTTEIIKNETLQNNIETVNHIDSCLARESTIGIKKAKKLFLSIAIGYGTNDVSRNNVFGQKKEEEVHSNALGSIPTTTASNSMSNILSLPKSGYHFSFGVNVEKQLNKKISLQSGLMYRCFENKITVNNNSVTNFLSTTTNLEYKNSLHLIEMPVGFRYCFNPNSKNKISLLALGNVAFALKKHWLYVNDDLHQYQENSDEINTVLVGLQTGASINFNNKFSLSLIAQKNITAIQKTSSTYYLQQVNFQLNIPFKSFKK